MSTDRLTRLATFFTSQAKPLTWAMALIVVYLLIDGFYEQQGHVEFDSKTISNISNYLCGFLYLFIIFRLGKPNSVQDIQALMLIFILPNMDFPLMYLGKQLLFLIVITLRWTNLSRKIGLGIVALALFNAPALLMGICSIPCGYPYTPKTGEFCSKTDQVYDLYKYHYATTPTPTYGLFRQVPILPGVRLVKPIDNLSSRREVCVCRTPEGNYTIVDGPPEVYK